MTVAAKGGHLRSDWPKVRGVNRGRRNGFPSATWQATEKRSGYCENQQNPRDLPWTKALELVSARIPIQSDLGEIDIDYCWDKSQPSWKEHGPGSFRGPAPRREFSGVLIDSHLAQW